MLAKAPGLAADELVIDLEDAVAASMKESARASVATALASEAWAGATVSVRVNAPRTPWCHLDIAALAAVARQPAAIVVPKVESAGDLAFVERLLDGAEAAAGRARPLRVQALIETAAGLSRVQEIAGASSRLDALILGYADLAVSLGRTGAGADDLDGWRPAQEMVLLAARAHGLAGDRRSLSRRGGRCRVHSCRGPGPGARLRWQVGDPPLAALGADRRLYADR